MTPPRVSVVMPAYNAGRYIREAIESILAQDFTDLELIVVDDGSSDDTASIVRAAGDIDPRVRLIRQPNSGKPAIARNRGIRESRGDVICFLDADDVWKPGKLTTCLGILTRSPDLDLVFHDVEYMSEDGTFTSRHNLSSLDFDKQVLCFSEALDEVTFLCNEKVLFFFMCTKVTTIFPSAAVIQRARLFQEATFFAEDVVAGEDADLWFRIVRTGGVAYVNRALSGYRIHPSSVTHQDGGQLIDAVQVHERNYARHGDFLNWTQRLAYRRRIAEKLFVIGYRQAVAGQHDAALRWYSKSLRWWPEWRTGKGLAKSLVLRVAQGFEQRGDYTR